MCEFCNAVLEAYKKRQTDKDDITTGTERLTDGFLNDYVQFKKFGDLDPLIAYGFAFDNDIKLFRCFNYCPICGHKLSELLEE